ncbi:MAG: TIGR02646 family protein [Brevundimonas sp.]|nr:MAG: TIGR02646 family protein [Brevundimonas sp.]
MAAYVAGPNPSWRQFRDERRDEYDELCAALYSRQRGLCAYCETDLRTSVGTPAREIEHWRPKSLDVPPATRFTFGVDNLRMGCFGGAAHYPTQDVHHTGNPVPGPNLSCGAAKKDDDPSALPRLHLPYTPDELPERPSLFTILDDGEIRAVADCQQLGFEADRLQATIDFLKLNCTRLKNARQVIIQSLNQALTDYLGQISEEADEDEFEAALVRLATATAPPQDEDLPRFVTTLRSYFGRSLDGVLFPTPGWATG